MRRLAPEDFTHSKPFLHCLFCVFFNSPPGVGDSGFTERRFPGARLSDQRWRLRADVPLGQRGDALQDRQSPGQIE